MSDAGSTGYTYLGRPYPRPLAFNSSSGALTPSMGSGLEAQVQRIVEEVLRFELITQAKPVMKLKKVRSVGGWGQGVVSTN